MPPKQETGRFFDTNLIRITSKLCGNFRIAAKIITLVIIVVFDYLSLRRCLDDATRTVIEGRQSQLRFTEEIVPTNSQQGKLFSASLSDADIPPSPNPRIAFIMNNLLDGGSVANDDDDRFRRMILTASKTSLQGHQFFVVMTSQSRPHYKTLCGQYSSECERIVPIFVDCPAGFGGDSLCCKVQEGLLLMLDLYFEYDWYYYGDDDNFIHVDYLEEYLSTFDAADQAIIVSPAGTFEESMREESYGNVSREDMCSQMLDITNWNAGSQPVIYSHAGLLEVKKGLQLDGLRKQCIALRFNHNLGHRVFNWMHQLPEVRLFFSQSIPSVLEEKHNVSMESGGRYHGSSKDKRPLQVKRSLCQNETDQEVLHKYQWRRDDGEFQMTETYKQYGSVTKWETWHTMRVEQCRGP